MLAPGEELDGTVALGPQSWWHSLSARLAGGRGSVVPTQDSSHSILLKPGCSSLVCGEQLILPWLLCSLLLALLWVKPVISEADKERFLPTASQEPHAHT